ncbi:MAG: D-tyrosyl-tRNA(Tyr) deacylase [Sporomusaceae bacterium]|nr:D-tyrosyl-tRNA(Tyr) deacylase [Sporomusaceae bacterium]
MRAVVQRTLKSSVTVNDQTIAAIDQGLTILLGVGSQDTEDDAGYLAEKIVNLRIFSDDKGKMNLSLLDINGDLLVISQFTLFGDCRKGRRPSFDAAAAPQVAQDLYEVFINKCRKLGIKTACGKFQSEMVVALDNHGPVTILLDSKRIF